MRYLRVWHMPQVGGRDSLGNPVAFYVGVADVNEAVHIINMLANYDLFQYNNDIKPDYTNANGLEVEVDGEWEEWFCPETGDDIGEIIRLAEEKSKCVTF